MADNDVTEAGWFVPPLIPFDGMSEGVIADQPGFRKALRDKGYVLVRGDWFAKASVEDEHGVVHLLSEIPTHRRTEVQV